jgi:DNA-binding transcriptional MerR regulator
MEGTGNIVSWDVGTLQPRHLSALQMSPRQLHLWAGSTGFEPDRRRTNHWRAFSPSDVLRLATMRALKMLTRLALVEQASLVKFLGKDFVPNCISLWRMGDRPLLITDMADDHRLGTNAINFKALSQKGVGFCILPLEGPMLLTLRAVFEGGTTKQKQFAQQIVADNSHHTLRKQKHGRLLEMPVDPLGEAAAANIVRVRQGSL